MSVKSLPFLDELNNLHKSIWLAITCLGIERATDGAELRSLYSFIVRFCCIFECSVRSAEILCWVRIQITVNDACSLPLHHPFVVLYRIHKDVDYLEKGSSKSVWMIKWCISVGVRILQRPLKGIKNLKNSLFKSVNNYVQLQTE